MQTLSYLLKTASQDEMNNSTNNELMVNIETSEGTTLKEKIENTKKDEFVCIGDSGYNSFKLAKLDYMSDIIDYITISFDKLDEDERNYIKRNIEEYNNTLDSYEILYIKHIKDDENYILYLEIKKPKYSFIYNHYSINIYQYQCYQLTQ